jgi:hypothetical protein
MHEYWKDCCTAVAVKCRHLPPVLPYLIAWLREVVQLLVCSLLGWPRLGCIRASSGRTLPLWGHWVSLVLGRLADPSGQKACMTPVAEFIDPWLGDKVNSGIGLSFRPARLRRLAGRVSTEFRRQGIPSVFFTSVCSVFRAELAKIPRNSAEFRVRDFFHVWNSVYLQRDTYRIEYNIFIHHDGLLLFFLVNSVYKNIVILLKNILWQVFLHWKLKYCKYIFNCRSKCGPCGVN